jgi:ParB family transcriptional regulator, chromosome partitioning protein
VASSARTCARSWWPGINPLRWIKGDPPPLEEVLKTMRERVAKFNVEKIKPQDLAGAAGPPDEDT